MSGGRVTRMLLATDRDWLAASIEGVLDHDRYDVRRTDDPSELAAMMNEIAADGVLLDQGLAGSDTPELCERLVADGPGEHIPLIVYSSDLRDEDLQTRIIEAGAWTVIQEPIRSRYLLATIDRFLRIGCTAREADAVADRRDDPAGLPDMEGVLDRLPLLESLAARHGTSLALVAVGPRQPATGELLERQRERTEELCREVLRRADLCGWLDEEGDVVIAAYGASRDGARRLAERLATRAAERSDVEVERPEDALSVGIVAFRPGEELDGVQAGRSANGETGLVQVAHEALHRAREAGGGIEFGG